MLVTGNVFTKKPVTTARLRRNPTTRQIRTEINRITNPTTALLVRKTSLTVLPTITITATTTSPQNRPLPQLPEILEIPEIPLIPLLTNWEKTVNFPQTNGNAAYNDLCLYCGIAGHKTKDCKKAAASKTKGRAAQVQDKDKDSSKKSLSSPHSSAHPDDCVNPCCALMEEVRLNASALSDPNYLRVPLTSALTSVIIALINSGSTDCFVDSNFAHTQDLPLTSIPPIRLRLLDGTSSAIIT